jgi:hypothetical protein
MNKKFIFNQFIMIKIQFFKTKTMFFNIFFRVTGTSPISLSQMAKVLGYTGESLRYFHQLAKFQTGVKLAGPNQLVRVRVRVRVRVNSIAVRLARPASFTLVNSRVCIGESTRDSRQLPKFHRMYWRKYSRLSPIGEIPRGISAKIG